MRIHRFVLGLAAGVLLAQSTPARPAAAPGIAAIKNYLGLSDQQVQQLVQLRREEQQVLQPLREQMREKSKALQEARQAANPNPTTVGQLVLYMQNLRKQVVAINEAYHAKALAVLDSAQKEKLEELRGAARVRPAVRGAILLNLLAGPAARPGLGMGPGAGAGMGLGPGVGMGRGRRQ